MLIMVVHTLTKKSARLAKMDTTNSLKTVLSNARSLILNADYTVSNKLMMMVLTVVVNVMTMLSGPMN